MSSTGSAQRPRPLFAGVFFHVQQVGGVYDGAKKLKTWLLASRPILVNGKRNMLTIRQALGAKYKDDPTTADCNIVFVFPPEGNKTGTVYRETGNESEFTGLWTYEQICLQFGRRRASERARKFVLGAGWVDACIKAGRQLTGERWDEWEILTKARVPAPISSAPPTPVEPPAAAPIDRSVSQPAATGYPPVKDGGLLASFNTPFFSCSFHVMPAPFQRMFEGSIVNEGGTLSTLEDAAFVFYPQGSQTPLPVVRASQRLLSLEWLDKCLTERQLVPMEPFLLPSTATTTTTAETGHQRDPAGTSSDHSPKPDSLGIGPAPRSTTSPAVSTDPRLARPSDSATSSAPAPRQPPSPPLSAHDTSRPSERSLSDRANGPAATSPQAPPTSRDESDDTTVRDEVVVLDHPPHTNTTMAIGIAPSQSLAGVAKVRPGQSSGLRAAIDGLLAKPKQSPTAALPSVEDRPPSESRRAERAIGDESMEREPETDSGASLDTSGPRFVAGSASASSKPVSLATPPVPPGVPSRSESVAGPSLQSADLSTGPRTLPTLNIRLMRTKRPVADGAESSHQAKKRSTPNRSSVPLPTSASSATETAEGQLPDIMLTASEPRRRRRTSHAEGLMGHQMSRRVRENLDILERALRQWLVDGNCHLTTMLREMSTSSSKMPTFWRGLYQRNQEELHRRIPELATLPFRHVPTESGSTRMGQRHLKDKDNDQGLGDTSRIDTGSLTPFGKQEDEEIIFISSDEDETEGHP